MRRSLSAMVNFSSLYISYLAGLFAPLGAVCVLPLYPAFISFLSEKKGKYSISKLTWVITSGIVISMFLFGLVFAGLFSSSLTSAISIVSPIAFGILLIIGVLMILGVDFSTVFPKKNYPHLKSPVKTSFLFGLFFGAIVLPCNPASLIILFALGLSGVDFVLNLFGFILFGIGMATPLIVFAYAADRTEKIIEFFARNKRRVDVVAGIIMVLISAYYLFFVFKILG